MMPLKQEEILTMKEIGKTDDLAYSGLTISDIPVYSSAEVATCISFFENLNVGQMRYIIEDEEEDFYK